MVSYDNNEWIFNVPSKPAVTEPDLSDLTALKAALGVHLGTSRWFEIPQTDIDAFGNLTQDRDAMHMDVDWAASNSPFGTTIAYGFQTLSMMTAMMNDIMQRGSAEAYKVNYGFDRIRLLAPVPAGSRIRGQARLRAARERDKASHVLVIEIEVEIEGVDTPAVVADWLFMVVNAEAHSRRPDMVTT